MSSSPIRATVATVDSSSAWVSTTRKPRRAHRRPLLKANEVSLATDIVVMGRVIGAYGVQGWIKARTFTASPDGLLAYRAWWLATGDDRWLEFAVLEARVHADALVARLEGMNRREEVAPWRGAAIGVPRGSLPALAAGEVY